MEATPRRGDKPVRVTATAEAGRVAAREGCAPRNVGRDAVGLDATSVYPGITVYVRLRDGREVGEAIQRPTVTSSLQNNAPRGHVEEVCCSLQKDMRDGFGGEL